MYPGHFEPVNLYTAVALPPGSRKSSVHAALTSPVLAAEKELASEARGAVNEARTARAVADKAAREAEKLAAEVAVDAGKSADEKKQAADDAVAKAALAGAIEIPAVPRLIADDCTPEEAASLLAEQGGKLAVMSAEGGPFVSLTGRYSREPNMEVFLKGWSGDMLRVDRKSRPPDFVDSPALTLGLAVQPEVLKQIYSMPGFSGRGLLARVLYSLPRNTVGYRRVRTSPVPPSVSGCYADTMKRLVRDYASWVPEPALFRLDPAAAEMLIQAAEQLEPCLRPDGALGHIAGWGAKLTGTTARIAGLLHGAAHLEGAYRHPVSADTMSRAIRLGRYLTEHAIAAFDFMGADPAADGAHAVLEWLRRTGQPQFNKRDLHRAMQARFRKAEDTEPALELLASHGWIREAQAPSPGRQGGRPPSPVFLVHPALLRKRQPL
jgi:hypothetical protein